MRKRLASLAGVLVALVCAPTVAAAGVAERVSTVALALPATLEPSQASYCTWEMCALSPRLYHAPLPDGRTLVGWTDADLNGHVSVVTGASITATFDFAARPVRGLVGHDDGSFAVLLWERSAPDPPYEVMWLSRRDASGVEQWSTRVTSTDNIPSAARDHVGDSRLAYGGGVYGAYLGVHGVTGIGAGHEYDEYERVSETGSPLSGGWTLGLAHSMAQLVAWHPEADALTTVGVSDCYPSKGLHAGLNRPIWASDADCAGMVQVQVGQMAAATNHRWLVLFNAVNRAAVPATGIGMARLGPTGAPAITWLTSTLGAEERDPVLARIGASPSSNRLLAGWRMQSGSYRLAVVDTSGLFVEGPVTLGPAVTWGNRDDSFRTRPDGAVSWISGAAGSDTLRLHVYAEPAIGVGEPATGTPVIEIRPAFPNPMRGGVARVRFRMNAAGPVTVRVLDAAGREIRELHRGWTPGGSHELTWDGRDARGAPVAAGVYLCTFDSAGLTCSGKLSVVR